MPNDPAAGKKVLGAYSPGRQDPWLGALRVGSGHLRARPGGITRIRPAGDIRSPLAGRPFAALSVASLVTRMPASRGKEILALLNTSARKIDAALVACADGNGPAYACECRQEE